MSFLNSCFLPLALSTCTPSVGSLEHDLVVFNHQISERMFVYNATIAGLVSNGVSEYGFKLHEQMRMIGVVPDKFAFPSLLRACSDVSESLEIEKIHLLLAKFGLVLDVFIGSSLVSTSYLNFQLMGDAQELFDELPMKDVVLWNSMVNGYSQIERCDEALELFRNMQIVLFAVTGVLSIFALISDFHSGIAVHGL